MAAYRGADPHWLFSATSDEEFALEIVLAPGDTVRAVVDVREHRPTSRPDRTVLVLDVGVRVDDEPPLATFTMLMLCRAGVSS